MSASLENLRRGARMRLESDSHMSTAWVIVPILPLVATIIFFGIFFLVVLTGGFFITNTTTTPPTTTITPGFTAALLGLVSLFYIAIFIIDAIWVYMLYKLVKRRNTHFNRQRFLYEDWVNLAKELAIKKGVDISLPLNNLERTYRESAIEETEKGAALWAILSFITGIAALYVYYFLMKDFFKHERREELFLEDLNRVLITAGINMNLPRRTILIPDRSFALYFILSLVTFGIFTIYWIYVLVEDPNNHFQQQAMIEDTILYQAAPLLQ